MTPHEPVRTRGGRVAVVTAVAGTVFIAAGAFWLSFTSLADLARRSGVGVGQAWAWPLIVDGIIVVATVAVVALAGQAGAWYPWALLIGGAVVSVTANAIHAIVAADADVPRMLAAAVASLPPLVLLAITHLTVLLTRAAPADGTKTADRREEPVSGLASAPTPVPPTAPTAELGTSREPMTGRDLAAVLRAERGWSNRAIARQLGVHPSTVGRWFATRPALTSTDEKETS